MKYKYLMDTVSIFENFYFESAQGDYLYGHNQKGDHTRLLDWFCDSGTVSLGYEYSPLNYKVGKFSPHIPNVLYWNYKDDVTNMLCNLTKMNKAFYCNSGSESIETAIKIIRKWNDDNKTGRKNIYVLEGAFHGRTYGALSASSSAPYHKKGFTPMLDGFKMFSNLSEIDASDCAGIILETVYGNNRVITFSKDYWQAISQFCINNSIPLCLDEIQAGACRTGKFNGFDNYDFVPDILCLAKGIACGVTTGVTLAKGQFAEVLKQGQHFSTFGGNPWSIIGIDCLIDYWIHNCEGGDLIPVDSDGKKIKNHLEKLNGVTYVNQIGLMIGVGIEGEKAFDVSRACSKEGLFVPTFRNDVVKIMPPLNCENIDVGISLFENALKGVFG